MNVKDVSNIFDEQSKEEAGNNWDENALTEQIQHFKLKLLVGHPSGGVKYGTKFMVQRSWKKIQTADNIWELKVSVVHWSLIINSWEESECRKQNRSKKYFVCR